MPIIIKYYLNSAIAARPRNWKELKRNLKEEIVIFGKYKESLEIFKCVKVEFWSLFVPKQMIKRSF